jgi:hypothetical protein
VHLRSPHHSLRVLADHARYERKQWLLPIPYPAEENISLPKLRQQALKDRREHDFEPRSV